jgi:VIT1/CCC1 family predicted Fe2+/Mn2+ transporter
MKVWDALVVAFVLTILIAWASTSMLGIIIGLSSGVLWEAVAGIVGCLLLIAFFIYMSDNYLR